MDAVLLDGSYQRDDASVGVATELTALLEAAGWTTNHIRLHELDIRPCNGCFGCWVKTPGQCQIQDDAPAVTREIIQSDLMVLLTPVTFGGYSSELKKALDRSICLVSPFFSNIAGETHHLPRYDTYPRLLGLGLVESPDEQAREIFRGLVGRNALNIHVPAHAADTVVCSGSETESYRAQLMPLLVRLGVV